MNVSYIIKNKLNRPIHSVGLLVGEEKKVSTLTPHMENLVQKGYLTATEIKSVTKKKTSKEVKK